MRRRALRHTRRLPRSARRSTRYAAGRGGDVFLLHGVTGSGKTLVYIELLRRVVVEREQTAIVLVPEIALTPQTVDRFRAVFGDKIAVLHSALSDGERYDEWLALREGRKQIAVGARSAVFAPLANLGAIVVDEEHEGSTTSRARRRATTRARSPSCARANEGAVVVLGSATPSLESWVNTTGGKYTLLALPERVGAASLPKVEVIDRREAGAAKRDAGSGGRDAADWLRMVVSDELEAAIGDRLAKKEQTILLLNRRGYAAFVQCGAVRRRRDVSQLFDQSHVSPVARAAGLPLLPAHRGAAHAVPALPRPDDAPARARHAAGRAAARRPLSRRRGSRAWTSTRRAASGRTPRFSTASAAGEVDILLGTQMIAKGLDFPNVTLVGVVDADVGINLPDFRASERCFQLLSQVAGRAGRGPKGGRVIIQTRVPSHHAVRCAVDHDYHRFVEQELAGRVTPAYPPNVRLANIVFSGTTEAATAKLATSATAWLHALLRKRPMPGLSVVGPAPCPVERIKNRWRWHVLIKAEHPRELTRLGRYFLERFPVPKEAQLRVTLDRDPVALL